MQTPKGTGPILPALPPAPEPGGPADDPRTLLPPGPAEWDALLTRAGVERLELLASVLWTGEVLETLSAPDGRWMLRKDGRIETLPPDTEHYRVVYLTFEQVAPLHARCPLVKLGEGTHSLRLRFATPTDNPEAALAIPPKVEIVA